MTILRLIFNKRIYTENDIYLFLILKLPFPPRKVRHLSPSRDIWFRPDAKYLHIDIFDQNLNKV